MDEILHGGLVPQRSYLLVGPAGSGKTVLSFQWLMEGRRHGEKLLYITLTEPADEIERNMATLGWTTDGMDLLDLTPTDAAGENHGEYHVFEPSEVEQTSVWQAIFLLIGPSKQTDLPSFS